jgi:hypothetical protein
LAPTVVRPVSNPLFSTFWPWENTVLLTSTFCCTVFLYNIFGSAQDLFSHLMSQDA